MILYRDKLFPLQEYFYIDNIELNNDKLEISIILLEEIFEGSYMFHNCKSLEEIIFPENNRLKEENNFNSKDLFWDIYEDLSSVNKDTDSLIISSITHKNSPNFYMKNWFSSNCKNLSFMFFGCSSLRILPDISNWITNNIKNMNYLFSGCSSLLSLPDISKWNTKNLENMNYLFNKCSSLCSLPDLSKWNTKNIKSMNYLFRGCISLSSLPNLSGLSFEFTSNNLFDGCLSLINLPTLITQNMKLNSNIDKNFHK